VLLGFFLSTSLAVLPAENAAHEDDPADPEKIIVTGERTPRTLRETPSSVVVLGAEAIEATGADRLDQLLELVPNVQIGSGEEGPAIRGQDSTGVLRNLFAFLGGTRPRVTLQVDGRPVTYYEYVASSAPLWDVEKVELFRSPQTTTQGRNSIAGAIFVETADPGYEWQGRARILAGSFRTRQASLAVSGPIVADQLAVGISGDLRLSRMASDMADGIAGADIDRDDYGFVRVKTLLEPAVVPGLRMETSYVHTRSQTPQFEAVQAPFRARRFPVPERTNGIHRINVDSLTTRIEYKRAEDLSSLLTLSVGDADIRRFGLPGLGLTQVTSRDYSAEGNLRWKSGDISLLAGLHHLVTDQNQSIDITGLGIGSGDFEDRQSSTGVFGEAQWRPKGPLAITMGLRYQSDRQEREGRVGNPPSGIVLAYDGEFDAWLPKVSLSYDLSRDVTAGLLVQKAYNPGGTSISLSRRVADTFEAESLWNYEAFLRTTFDGARGLLSANVFFNDIRDAQRQQLVPVAVAGGGTIFATEFANAPKARTYGAEAEVSWRSKQITLRAGLGMLRTKVVETVLPTDITRGRDFQRSPKLSAAAAIDWTPSEPLRLSAQVRHHSGYFSDDANTLARRIPAATIVDLRGAFTAGKVTVFGYARNALNAFTLSYLFTPTFGTANDPREIGLGIEARF
jgi:outer membrane receptor protein involved in Fe transport